MEYLDSKQILPDVQSGFIQGHSCSTALLQIMDDVLSAKDIGEYTVLLDFTRAFDTLNHKLLLSTLKHIGTVCQYVNEDLNNYINLSVDHCLLNSAKKTKVMLFRPQNKRSEVIPNIDININGVQIPISERQTIVNCDLNVMLQDYYKNLSCFKDDLCQQVVFNTKS
nr:unnamed protein product [Callosobruchus analis]